MSPEAAVKFLEEAARHFDQCAARTDEDVTHWANVYNADNCRQIAQMVGTFTPQSPSDERRSIAALLNWWAKEQARMSETTVDLDKEIEFAIRAKALADAARHVLDFGDKRSLAYYLTLPSVTPE